MKQLVELRQLLPPPAVTLNQRRFRMKLKRLLSVTLIMGALLGASFTLTSCNTITGAGEDISSLGRAMGASN